MKKFIKNIIIFSSIVLIPFLIVNYLYIKTDGPFLKTDTYWLKNYPAEIEVVNLGNSHAYYGFNYENDKYHNLSTLGQTMYYNYQMLDEVKDNLAEDATVIIPISIFEFYYDMEYYYTANPTYNNRYYRLLSNDKIYNYDFENFVENEVFPIFTAQNKLEYVLNDRVVPDIKTNEEIKVSEDIELEAKERYKYWDSEVINTNQETIDFNVKYFDKIIELCKENNFEPVVVIMPVTDELISNFSEDYMSNFNKLIDEQKNKYSSVKFLNYLNDDKYITDYSLYMDSDHLNKKGSEMFTNEILNEIGR